MDKCILCGRLGTEDHHTIKRSQAKYLIRYKLNIVKLCWNCHRGTTGVHGKNGKKTDTKLKTMYYCKISKLFNKPVYEIEELRNILELSANDFKMLTKTITESNGTITREKLLLALMGFKIDVEVKEIDNKDNN